MTDRAPPRPRRRIRRVGLAALLLGLFLAGRGLGWFGTAPAAGVAAGEPVPAAAPAVGPGAPVANGAVPPPGPDGGSAPERGAVAAAPAAAVASPPASPVAEPAPAAAPAPTGPTFDADRVASLLSLVEERAAAGQFRAARATLQTLQAAALGPGEVAAVAAAAVALEQQVQAAMAAVCADLAAGAARRAAARLSGWLDSGDWPLPTPGDPALPEALRGDPRRPVAADAAVLLPLPLPAERAVRWATGAEAIGRIVSSRADRVTLRFDESGGVTFPTVAVTEVEPVEPVAAEAVELGFAALRAGNPLLARCWLAVAQARGGGGARGERLAACLR